MRLKCWLCLALAVVSFSPYGVCEPYPPVAATTGSYRTRISIPTDTVLQLDSVGRVRPTRELFIESYKDAQEDSDPTTLSNEVRPEIGFDALGIQSPDFNVESFARRLPQGVGLGSLDWTFGTSLAPIERVLQTGKVTFWRVHFFNGPGLRNGNLGPYEPHAQYTVKSFSDAWERNDPDLVEHLRIRAKLFCDLFEKYPSTELDLSGTVEHNLSGNAVANQLRVLRKACPRAKTVNNPQIGQGAGADYEEKHGPHPTVRDHACIISLDGNDATDIHMDPYLASKPGCRKMVWSRVYNGRWATGWEDPRARTAWPTRNQIVELFLYAAPLTLPGASTKPLSCKTVLPIKAPEIWKPWAEAKKGLNDIRAMKPVRITRTHGQNIIRGLSAVDKGAQAFNLKYYGTFPGNLYRYYSGTGSNLTVLEMFKLSPYWYLQEGSTCYGPFHPMYRQGAEYGTD